MDDRNERLIAFFAARLDELETIAKAATGALSGRWRIDSDGDVQDENPEGSSAYVACGPWEGPVRSEYAEHIAANDPAHVLADIAADRKLLAAYRPVMDMDYDDTEPEYACGRAVGLGTAVRIRAARFSGHPDYDPALAEGIPYRFGED